MCISRKFTKYETCANAQVSYFINRLRLYTFIKYFPFVSDFSLSTSYVFQSPHAKSIEASLLSLLKHTENKFIVPRPHFSIHHGESASGFIPGTSSENFSITPHCTNPDCHDSSGSHSNGHIPSDPRRLSDNIFVHSHPAPAAHFQGSTSSNGQVHGSGSATFVKEFTQGSRIVETHSSSVTAEIEMNNNTVLLRRGAPDTKIVNVNANMIMAKRPETLGNVSMVVDSSKVVDECKTRVKQCPSPPQKHGSLSPSKELCDSSPIIKSVFGIKSQRFSAGDADLEGLDFVEFNFEEEDLEEEDLDLSLQPPPTPCVNIAHPVQQFRYKPPAPLPKPGTYTEETDSGNSNKYIHPLPRKPKAFLMRSQSFDMLNDSHLSAHSYVNVELQSVQMRNIHDDPPYFRFYYNYGFVRMMDARMSKKIERRSRLSSYIDNIDFNLLDKHEMWYDRCYKSRDKDLKYLK